MEERDQRRRELEKLIGERVWVVIEGGDTIRGGILESVRENENIFTGSIKVEVKHRWMPGFSPSCYWVKMGVNLFTTEEAARAEVMRRREEDIKELLEQVELLRSKEIEIRE